MLNYYLQINSSGNKIVIEIMVGDEVIMSKHFNVLQKNNMVYFNKTLFKMFEMKSFINNMRENENDRIYLINEENYIEYIEHNATTELFTFVTVVNENKTVTTCVMSQDKNKQFCTELEKINKFVGCLLLARD